MNESRIELDAGQILRDSWKTFYRDGGLWIAAAVVFFLILSISEGIPFLPWVVFGPLLLGLYKMARTALISGRADFMDLFWGFQRFLPAFLTNVVVSLFVVIGLCLLIIPGLVVGLLYLPVYLFIVDRNLDFWQAMESSRKMVLANFTQWLKLGLVLMALNLAGTLALVVGLLVTVPMSVIAVTLAYDLQQRAAEPIPLHDIPDEPLA